MVPTASCYDLPVRRYSRFGVMDHFFTFGGYNFEILERLKLTWKQQKNLAKTAALDLEGGGMTIKK